LAELRHEIDAKRAERDALVKATRLHGLVVVTAPEDGVVLELATRSVGSVLREAESFITWLPLNAPLIAEVMVDSHDVGYVRAGDAVVIEVDAFPYQRHGLLRGTLRSISQASVSGERQAGQDLATASSGRFHRMQVVLTETGLGNLPDGARLIPGMTMTAEVKVDVRSIISYFLYPITRGFDESIREP